MEWIRVDGRLETPNLRASSNACNSRVAFRGPNAVPIGDVNTNPVES